MRKTLVLIAIGSTMLMLLSSILMGARYVLSPAPILQFGTLLNLYARPLVALLITIVLAARFADFWSGRAALSRESSSRMAGFAQTLGIALIAIGVVTLTAVLVLNFTIPSQFRGQIPLFFLFGPFVAFIPLGYFTFEIGLSMSRDRATSP